MKVLVCGGRDFADRELFNRTLDKIHGGEPTRNIKTLIHGGAKGADSMCWGWVLSRNHGCSDERQLGCWVFHPDWEDLSQADSVIKTNKFGKKYDAMAGFRRNKRMLEEGKPDLVVAFPGGKGTANMVSLAKQAGVKVIEVK